MLDCIVTYEYHLLFSFVILKKKIVPACRPSVIKKCRYRCNGTCIFLELPHNKSGYDTVTIRIIIQRILLIQYRYSICQIEATSRRCLFIHFSCVVMLCCILLYCVFCLICFMLDTKPSFSLLTVHSI